MDIPKLLDVLACSPVIAAVREKNFEEALVSPAAVLFYVESHLTTVKQRIAQAHAAEKVIFVHIDLAEGIGKDKEGLQYLADCGVDGILSTRGQLIKMAKNMNILAVQRFFAMDTQGLNSAQEMIQNTNPHMMEILPGVIPKVIASYASGSIPVIASGLIENKQEITAALSKGAVAVSTGTKALWYI